MNNELEKAQRLTRAGGRESVKLGEYRWVKIAKKGKVPEHEGLYCVTHLASNHIELDCNDEGGGTRGFRIRYRDLEAETRLEPDPQRVINARIAEKTEELQQVVAGMIEMVKRADLIPDGQEPPSLLPSTTRRDPKDAKQSLIRLKEKEFPAAEGSVEQITREIVALHKDLTLPMRAQTERMKNAVEGIDKRLFALELYAGLGEDAKLIRRGKPADPETQVSVRQMLRYMDEETLIAAEDGGMDFADLDDFDAWVAQQENLDRMAPEPRCVVAFKVRRREKDYGPCSSLSEAFSHSKWNGYNKKTYLLIRNGEQVWRLETDIDFDPRLLPFRNEFAKPLKEKVWHASDEEQAPVITPDHLDYDKALAERMNKVYEYNRVMFLIQGLLDRSKVFAPHPHINLADEEHIARYFRAVFDEELGLPSSNPPSWVAYRDAANAGLKRGDYVFCDVVEDDIDMWNRFGNWKKPHPSLTRPKVCQVRRVSKDGKVQLRWSVGDRVTEEWVLDRTRPVPNKPNFYYQKKVEINHGEKFCRQTVELSEVFAVANYKPGDYKQFLCDAHLKGQYLRWAPPLLAAERWHRKLNVEGKQ